MPTLDQATYGLPLEGGYGFAEAATATRHKPLWGRARYRFRDTVPSLSTTVTYDWDDDTFRAFQAFWDSELFYGTLWFTIPLMLANNDPDSGSILRQYTAHATGPYEAAHSTFGRWQVSIPLEVAYKAVFVDCDDIYGGPISALATDVVYAGSATDPAEDIIAPCPTVDPHA